MKSVSEKGYAKVNLYLDIVGISNGYHMLESLVVTVDIKDKLKISKRNDDKITISTPHSLYEIGEDCDNNAYKAAKLFQETFKTSGVDIELKKEIPVGSGMGGSSSDISATLKGMKKLFQIDCDLKPLADSLGSDSGYLLNGGYAKMSGRGEIVESLDIDTKLYFLIITADGGVNTAKCFAEYDKMNIEEPKSTINALIDGIKTKSFDYSMFYNALFEPACRLNNNVRSVYDDLNALSPKTCLMSGSGSSVYAIFDSLELCEWAKEKLSKKYKNIIITQSLTQKELQKSSFWTRSIYRI